MIWSVEAFLKIDWTVGVKRWKLVRSAVIRRFTVCLKISSLVAVQSFLLYKGPQGLPSDFEEDFGHGSGDSSDNGSDSSSGSDLDSEDEGGEEVNGSRQSSKSAENMTDIIKGIVDRGSWSIQNLFKLLVTEAV